MSFYRDQLEEWLKELDVRAVTVYDVGGAQKPVKDRVKSWKVAEYKILDLPEYDLEESSFYPYEPSDSFNKLGRADLIFCLEVFEYIVNGYTAMHNLNSILDIEGKAYISVPLVYPVHNEVDKDSVRYTENGFKRLCELANLKAEVVHYRKDRSGELQVFYVQDGMKAARGFDHSVTGYIFEVTHKRSE